MVTETGFKFKSSEAPGEGGGSSMSSYWGAIVAKVYYKGM